LVQAVSAAAAIGCLLLKPGHGKVQWQVMHRALATHRGSAMAKYGLFHIMSTPD